MGIVSRFVVVDKGRDDLRALLVVEEEEEGAGRVGGVFALE